MSKSKKNFSSYIYQIFYYRINLILSKEISLENNNIKTRRLRNLD